MGGGDTAKKIKGIDKEVRTSTTVKTVAISEVVLDNKSASSQTKATLQ